MKNISQKLFSLQGKLKVEKNGTNPHFKSQYVTLDNLLGVLMPMLEEQKLMLTNFISDRKLITLVYDIENDESIESSFPITQDDPQKIGSCITYAKRYNLGAIFNIITEFDDDGNSISGDNFRSKNTKGLDLDDYLQSIEMEEDIEHIRTLYTEAVNTLKLTEGQKELLLNTCKKRTDKLKNPVKYNSLPN